MYEHHAGRNDTDAALGVEDLFKAPVSLSLNDTLFMEVVDEPFLFSMQAEMGLRFRFK